MSQEAGLLPVPSPDEVHRARQAATLSSSDSDSPADIACSASASATWRPKVLVLGESRPSWWDSPRVVDDAAKDRVAGDMGIPRAVLGHVFGRMRQLDRPHPLAQHVKSAVRYWGLPRKGPAGETAKLGTVVITMYEIEVQSVIAGADAVTRSEADADDDAADEDAAEDDEDEDDDEDAAAGRQESGISETLQARAPTLPVVPAHTYLPQTSKPQDALLGLPLLLPSSLARTAASS